MKKKKNLKKLKSKFRDEFGDTYHKEIYTAYTDVVYIDLPIYTKNTSFSNRLIYKKGHCIGSLLFRHCNSLPDHIFISLKYAPNLAGITP